MRFSWIAVAALAFLLGRAGSPPTPPRSPPQVIVVAPPLQGLPCDESCSGLIDRVPEPGDCLGCPATSRPYGWR